VPKQGQGPKGKKGKKGKKREHTEEQPEQALSPLREYFLTIVVCTVIALFVTTFVLHPHERSHTFHGTHHPGRRSNSG